MAGRTLAEPGWAGGATRGSHCPGEGCSPAEEDGSSSDIGASCSRTASPVPSPSFRPLATGGGRPASRGPCRIRNPLALAMPSPPSTRRQALLRLDRSAARSGPPSGDPARQDYPPWLLPVAHEPAASPFAALAGNCHVLVRVDLRGFASAPWSPNRCPSTDLPARSSRAHNRGSHGAAGRAGRSAGDLEPVVPRRAVP